MNNVVYADKTKKYSKNKKTKIKNDNIKIEKDNLKDKIIAGTAVIATILLGYIINR